MFSVVMPVWNKQRFLEATLEAAFAQEWRDFELIAVDDGSTDGSLDLLRAVRDPRLRIVTQDNRGPGAARNAGIAAARHDWIAFLDADDLWLPCHLAELDRVRALHPGPGLIGTGFVKVRAGRPCPPDPARTGRIAPIDYLAATAAGRNRFITSSCAIHRRVHEDLGGFGPFPNAQDHEYWTRIALRWPMIVSSRRTAIYLAGTGGITDRITARPRARPPLRASEVSPAAALLIARRGALAGEGKRIDAFVAAEIRGCTYSSACAADVETLRSLRAFAPAPLRRLDRLLYAIAALPRPVARAAFRIGFGLWPAVRPVRRWWKKVGRPRADRAGEAPAPLADRV